MKRKKPRRKKNKKKRDDDIAHTCSGSKGLRPWEHKEKNTRHEDDEATEKNDMSGMNGMKIKNEVAEMRDERKGETTRDAERSRMCRCGGYRTEGTKDAVGRYHMHRA